MRREAVAVSGFVKPGFEPVREAFVDNFVLRKELGAACCMYRHGERVVDLWAGVRDPRSGAPWQEDTMVLVFSTTKGMSGLAMALAHSRGWLDYDERVCAYWPEFAQAGKARITVRQLLSHQAGLFALDVPVDRSVISDLDRLSDILARQRPEWAPGSRQAYHAVTLGFYEGELLRRIDPEHRSLGQFFQDEIAGPLRLDFYIRLPGDIPNARLAPVVPASPLGMFLDRATLPMALSALRRRSPVHRALLENPGMWVSLDRDTVYARNLEVPAGGGVGTARAIAGAYSEFATGGHELGVRPATLAALMAPAIAPSHGFHDECLKIDWHLSLGFMKPGPGQTIGCPGAFGTPGAGGSMGFADPERGVAGAYVMNRMGPGLIDPRMMAVLDAFNRTVEGRSLRGRPQVSMGTG